VFVAAVYFAVWGLVSSFRTTEDLSGLQNCTLAAAGAVSKAASVLDVARSKRRVEYQALELTGEKTKAANEVVAKMNLSLDKESKNRDSKHKSLLDGVAEEKEHQKLLHQRTFDEEKAFFNKGFAEKLEKHRANAQHADEAAAEAYKIAFASWSSVEKWFEEFGMETEEQRAKQPTFEIFFKQQMMKERQRLREPKKKVPELLNQSPAPAARSPSPSAGWKLLGLLATPFIHAVRRKHWPTQEERDQDAHDERYPKPED
jgi:hypothetical protein